MQSSAESWRQTAFAAAARGDHRTATQALERAFALAPGDRDLQSRLAQERLLAGDVNGARSTAREAGSASRIGAQTLDRLGAVLCRTQDFDQGVAMFRRAAAQSPADPAILKNLAWGAKYVGSFEEAEEALRRTLVFAPDDAHAWFALSELPEWKPSIHAIAVLDDLAASVGHDADLSLAAGHALAVAYEAHGDHRAALAALTRAKAARRAQRPYNVQTDLDLFKAAVTAWERGPQGAGASSAAPIFVVGPPRSGTTLLDRILSSHPGVTSAGEAVILPSLARMAARQPTNGPLTAEILLAGVIAPARQMGEGYLGAAAKLVGSSVRFIDKRPFNLILAGMISRILPNARILRMRRNPADTVVGNYRQLFNSQSLFHDYAYDLEDTARYVAGMESLSEAWEERLPKDRYQVIDYSALVADPEPVVRKALAFCGLDWDPACLSFHQNRAAVSTASAVQVREPLHGRNVGVWHRYGSALELALAVLRAEGRLEDAGAAVA